MEQEENVVVFTAGTFDMFHSGHVNFLRQCAKIGSVVVALNQDDFIEKYKGKKPIISFADRKKVLESCIYVDRVIPNYGGEDSKVVIQEVNPDFIVIGSDWAKKDYYKQMNFTQEWLDERNITLLYVPYTEGISSTDIKKRFT